MSRSDETRKGGEALACKRTDLAVERTVLASERTLSAWIRTGLAAMAAGLGIARLLGSGTATWPARIVGIILILVAIGCFGIGAWRYLQAQGDLKAQAGGIQHIWMAVVLVTSLVASALLSFLILFQS